MEDENLESQSQRCKDANIQALLSNKLEVTRQAFIPRLLSCPEQALKKPFKSPHPTAINSSVALKRKLLARRKFVPWGGAALPRHSLSPKLPEPESAPAPPQSPQPGEPPVEPLILWEPEEGQGGKPVEVDAMLCKWLRPHQREGIQFMFECVAGLRQYEGQGCILADDMGLGKTLQGISLLWTLLGNGHEALGGDPIAKRIIIVCPTSLVSNWDSECSKWLKGRVKTLPLCESSREDVTMSIAQFLSPRNYFQVLIVSYETFRIHADKFKGERSCDLLICDEAHRLKNDQTLTNKVKQMRRK
ncbi:hypothetical protein WJX84_003791 [Apatococcus fuscideae]|uniref:Helicase ATP-binding domain-containing protein n=1 Tax=Apatococcus fuscideae TaxID=2026836 RepID=A0AAW1T1D0_9CHLO